MSEQKLCMVDIETLATTPDAKIISIGAVDVYGGSWFYEPIDTNYFSQGQRKEDTETLDWWEKQQTRRPDFYATKALATVLGYFIEWYKEQKFTEVWCRGTDFDITILTHAFKFYKFETPWKYNEVRDLRTLVKVFPNIEFPIKYKVHHALIDAIAQSEHLKRILSKIEMWKSSQ